MKRNKSSEQVTILTSSNHRKDFNVIESLNEYNRSQTNKLLCIENNTALDHDVYGTHGNDVPQLTERSGIVKTVVKHKLFSSLSRPRSRS